MDHTTEIAIPAAPHDPEDVPTTREALESGQNARLIRQTRTKLNLSQPEFATRYRIPLETLRDWEQARVTPPDFAVAYMQVIVHRHSTADEVLAS
ncbi:helix-turn-helix domain-containing protein [Acidiphilium acidophilum]|uniref:Transcriptional regulator n=1 Tax=Acidiphilium acidophilum TaxID=76588 RepID=A0AAW9DU22_ACIAO|nr:transcriptional regulator [Acidiphilium acidophilum]MDX5932574.1 transcriptional regulator [Acidiphilium acidophilum]